MNTIKNDFFVIDSDNLTKIEKKLYGFSINEHGHIQTDENLNSTKLTKLGEYIFIDVEGDEIKIYQDFNGSYGLYLYQKDDYFALSNSFIKLADYLKKTKNTISLNEDYINSFLFADLVSIAYEETSINEIINLPRNYEIHINKSEKKISFKEIDFKENSIELDSKEGIEILDKWFYKWINIFRYIKSISNNIMVDLTGGFDSRIISAIWLNANINLDEIKINSYNDNKICHPEDFRIASEIAKEFNFKLNQNLNVNKIGYDNIYTPLFNSFYPKSCFHTAMNFRPFKYETPLYHFTGAAGECLRGYPNTTPNEFLKNLKNHTAQYDSSLIESVEKIFKRTIDKLSAKYGVDKDSKEIMEIHYKETRTRLHYGKEAVESFFSNEYFLNPFFDEDLYKLKLTTKYCNDKKLLFALIFARFCPKLLNFDYEGGRSIDESTIEYAKELNNSFPLHPKILKTVSKQESIIEENLGSISNTFKTLDVNNFLKNIFYSKSFEMEFKKYFSDVSYKEIHNLIQYSNFYPLRSVYTAISILKIINDVKVNALINNDERYWFENILNESKDKDNYLNIKKNLNLTKYATSRIDIKNFGKNNRIEILQNSDSLSSVTQYPWFKDEKGEGIVIQSDKGNIDLEIKCINEGNLKIWFRGINFLTKNNERFPIYINFIYSTVNGEEILKNKLAWHDAPILFEKNVLDSEVIKLHVEWEPVSDDTIFYNTLKLNHKNLENEIKTLKDENNTLKNKNEYMSNLISEVIKREENNK